MASITSVKHIMVALAGAGPTADREALLRRILPQGLERVIEQHVRIHGAKDRLTEGIETWYGIARNALMHAEEGKVGAAEAKAKSMLKKILIDSFTLAPLDESALFGSDGAAYLQQTLIQYALNPSVPESFKQRSPLFPNDSQKLETSPHEVARHMVSWLKGKDSNFREGIVTTEERIKAVRDRRLEKEARSAAARAARVEALLSRDRVAVAETLDPGIARQRDATSRIMRTLQEARKRQALEAEAQDASIAELEAGVAACREEVPELHERSERVEARIQSIEENAARIDQKIQATQQAIDEGKGKDPWGDVLKVALVIAVCAASGWAIQSAIQAMGAGSSVTASGTVVAGAKGSTAAPGLGFKFAIPPVW